MLSIKIDEEKLIAILQPEGPLSEQDFQLATNQLAPFIKNSKRLNGLIIYTKFFPGWQSLPALFSHFRFVKNHHKKALILGTGGASKAIAYALKRNDIKYIFVSRNPEGRKEISYDKLNEEIIKKYAIIINSTPLGTSPNIEKCPNIPYQYISEKHILFDLIYNPAITTFLSKGKAKGATIKNGLEMLELQAEESWRIWND